MPKTLSLSPQESRALAAARRALARGAFAEVARRYEQAARAREDDGGEGNRHWRRALDFWVAAGESRGGLACARLLLRRRLAPRDRGAVFLGSGQLQLAAGRAREAIRDFGKARALLSGDRDRRRLALLGEAEAKVALGEPLAARSLFARCFADAERSGDAWTACSSELKLATLDLWMGDALAAREALESVRVRAAARHLRSIEAEAATVLAEAELALGRAEQAQREAEHAAHLYREMERDSEADYVGRWEAAAIAARLSGLDPATRETAGPVLWREALRKLAKARRAAEGRRIAEAEILIEEARLLSGRAAAERMRRAKKLWPTVARSTRLRAVPRAPEEPEPRARALARALAERSGEHERLAARLRGKMAMRARVRIAAGKDPDRARWAIQAARRGDAPPLLEPATLPRLRTDERMVVLSRHGEHVEAWVAPGPSAHFRLGEVASWRAALDEISRQVRDAEGWPDSVVPESLIDNSRRTLERFGGSVWTPLWPALSGAARVLIVPDPALPDLPWTALLLAAPPERWPRPRMLALLSSASAPRPEPWTLRPNLSLALAERSAEQSIAEREARAVARVLRGQWKALVPGALDTLAEAKLHHWAPAIVVPRPSPALTRFPDGEDGVPLWRMARRGVHPELVVLPRLESEERPPLEVARIVGRVGPEGARRAGAGTGRRKTAPAFPDAAQLARTLLAAGASRVVVNAWPYEAPASAGLVGAFYAGLARGDEPAEALFTAQRRAFDEGLHPAAWAGFSMWGWP